MSTAPEMIFASSRTSERNIEMRLPSRRATLRPSSALPKVAWRAEACITGQ